jgi:phosphatidylserine decarboxylase
LQLNDSVMKLRSVIASLVQHEDLNFLLTNRIPRRWLTLFLGWFSKLEHPFVRDFSLRAWRLFSDLDLSDAKRTDFKSLHDCFTRELRAGARPLNPDHAHKPV